jgi:hypothetical protein
MSSLGQEEEEEPGQVEQSDPVPIRQRVQALDDWSPEDQTLFDQWFNQTDVMKSIENLPPLLIKDQFYQYGRGLLKTEFANDDPVERSFINHWTDQNHHLVHSTLRREYLIARRHMEI